MSTTFRNQGFTTYDAIDHSTRQVFTLPNGNVMAMVRDYNSTSAAVGYGERNGTEKVYVYESSDRANWTLRATITAPTAGNGGIRRISGATFTDNSLAIWLSSYDQSAVSYCKLTYSGYAVSAWETVYSAGSGYLGVRIDGTVTATGVPILLMYESGNSQSNARVFIRRTSTNTWFSAVNNLEGSFEHSNGGGAVTLASLGGTATARNMVACWGMSNPSGNDWGCRVKTFVINESTGAVSTAWTTRTNYANGDALGSTTTKAQGREMKLFQTATDEYTLAIMHSEVNRYMYVARGTFVGGTWTETLPASHTYTSTGAANLVDRSMAIVSGVDTVTFFYAAKNQQSTNHQQMINYTARIDRASNTVRWSTLRGYWNDCNPSGSDTWNIYGGGSDQPTVAAEYDTIQLIQTGSNFRFDHMYSYPGTIAPTQVTPASGATMTDANPSLQIKADTNRKYTQTETKVQWQFAKDSLFTTNLQTYRQPDSDLSRIDGTNVSGVTVSFADKLPSGAYTLSQGTWYVRSALVDENEQLGPYSSASTFSVSHPPAASNLAPSNSSQFTYGTGQVSFSWKFTDPSGTDYQTAYQIVVQRNDTSATVVDSGKVTSANQGGTLTIPAAYKDVLLQWHVRLWDRDDVAGAYSDYALFKLADPPTVTVSAPASGGTVTSGIPSVTFTPTVGGGRTIVAWVVNILQGSTVIWSKSKTNKNSASGTAITEIGNRSYLTNNQSYTVQVQVTDSTGLQGTSTAQVFATSWVAPVAPSGLAVDASQYNVEDQGYVAVTWSDTGRDADFSGWGVYRRDNLIDSTGAIVSAGSWNLIYVEYNISTSGYVYWDYLAPAGYQVDYRITQQVNRFGDIVESANTNFSSVVPYSDGYWLVTPTVGTVAASAFRLSIVVSDDYTEEYEQEEYTVIGRGRHVDKGDRLGWNGSLVAQLRDSPTQTAREKKLRVDAIKDSVSVLWLRNPFGDSFPVSIGDIQVSRIAGVGTSEFCDITVPYSEVGV